MSTQAIIALPPETLQALLSLAAHRPPPQDPRIVTSFPRRRRAAVLLALFVGRKGDLYVILSRRSNELRSYPGDVSLPGGKLEPGDQTMEDCARREAFEEVGLPLDRRKVRHVCTLEPNLSRDNLLVTPVVVLVTDLTIYPSLNTQEVSQIFALKLSSFLSDQSPYADPPPTPKDPTSSLLGLDSRSPLDPSRPSHAQMHPNVKEWAVNLSKFHEHRDIPWGRGMVRIHRFLTNKEHLGLKPVQGFTASILIRSATIAYSCEPSFGRNAPSELSMSDRIKEMLDSEGEAVTAGRTKEYLLGGMGQIGGETVAREGRRSKL